MARKTYCFRCGNVVNPNGEPIERAANYVQGSDMVEDELVVRTIGVIEGYAEDIRKDIETRQINPDSEEPSTFGEVYDTQELQHMMLRNDDRLPFEIDPNLFNRVPIDSPGDIKDDIRAVRAESETVEVERQKTGVVCSECLRDDDEIIWGIDK